MLRGMKTRKFERGKETQKSCLTSDVFFQTTLNLKQEKKSEGFSVASVAPSLHQAANASPWCLSLMELRSTSTPST